MYLNNLSKAIEKNNKVLFILLEAIINLYSFIYSFESNKKSLLHSFGSNNKSIKKQWKFYTILLGAIININYTILEAIINLYCFLKMNNSKEILVFHLFFWKHEKVLKGWKNHYLYCFIIFQKHNKIYNIL